MPVLFSDIDGTLAHYLADVPAAALASGCIQRQGCTVVLDDAQSTSQGALNRFRGTYTCTLDQDAGQATRIMPLPPSSTGLQAWISLPTLHAVSAVRKAGHPFVLISGARTSTILQRLPFLPRADAVVTENGGRIFLADAAWATCYPLHEDMQWRARHNATAGPAAQEPLPASGRQGSLWDLYRKLAADGWKLDTTSYSTCFRVKDADESTQQQLLRHLPEGLTSAVNMGKADVYPVTSGKAQAAAYLAQRFGATLDNCAFMCDDDNDIALAQAVGKAYCPSVSSDSLRHEVAKHPEHYAVASDAAPFVFGCEEALQVLCQDWGIALVPWSVHAAESAEQNQEEHTQMAQAC